MLSDPWQLFSYNLSTRHLRPLAQAHPQADGSFPAAVEGTHARVTTDGRVFYTAAAGQGHQVHSDIYTLPADGSTPPQLVAHDADAPSVTLHHLLYVNRATRHVDAAQLDSVNAPAPLPEDPGCAAVETLGAGMHAAAVEDCHGQGRIVVFTDDGQSLRRSVTVFADGAIRYPRMTQSYLAFATGSGPYKQYLYGFSSGALVTLGSGPLGGDMPGGGRIVDWTSYNGPGHTGVEHVAVLRPTF